MTTAEAPDTALRACRLDELVDDQPKVVSVGGRTIVLFLHEGRLSALDNRCPHMGFPLSRGTVSDGILTCHWHHARFDLCGGSTFDPFADDVASFHTQIRGGDVWIDTSPVLADRSGHWRHKLDEGLEQNLPLVLAKAVIALEEFGETGSILERAALFGTRNRSAGWSTGLSILTAMANVMPVLDPADRPQALYQGLVHVARSTQGQPPDFGLAPLGTTEQRPEVFTRWFRRFIETRSEDSAERSLRTAVEVGLGREAVAEMVFTAATDHLFLDTGHAFDFSNKAFELVERIGWGLAEEVLPSIVPVLARAQRMEETSAWRHPVDLAALLAAATSELPSDGDRRGDAGKQWSGHRELAELILDGPPAETLEALLRAMREGTPLADLSATVAYAAARRAVHFHISNEFGDWDTVHHTFTYANAVDQAVRRTPSGSASRELRRGILDGAMAVHLDRFLNVPKQPLPDVARGGGATSTALLAEFDQQGRIDETADLAAAMLGAGRHEEVIRTLGHALLREDSGFHEFQIFEAAVRQYQNFRGRPEGDHILIGAARFLSAHSPTVRAVDQTYQIAARLHRGEALHEDA